MIVSKEVLEAAGPVNATGQKAEHALLAAHVAVPRVLFDGRMCRPLTDQEVHTLHTKTPTREAQRSPQDGGTREHGFVISFELDR